LLELAKKGEYGLHYPLFRLAAIYAMLGQGEEARIHVEELLKLDPNYTVKRLSKTFVYKNQVDADRIINALRKAGLPE